MSAEIKSFDPSNGELVGTVPVASHDQITDVVNAAHIAQASWSSRSISERKALLQKAYLGIQDKTDEIAETLSKEMGKDIRRSSMEVSSSINMGQYMAEEAIEAFKPVSQSRSTVLQYRPLGVVAVISPWNYPVMMANNLIVPALMAGNTVVLKPSEETPLVAQAFFGELQKYLPENVLNIIHGDGHVGEALVKSDIHMIAFTGSQAVGRKIMSSAADKIKRLVMELGGNDPMIVLNDADVQHAARFAVASSFENAGQMCTSVERIYVDEAIADQFEILVSENAKKYQVGPWDQPDVNIGPIINEKQHQKIVAHIQDAETKGARVLLGGSDQEARYITPTVLSNVTPDMLMEREETFGPVVSISRFQKVEDAIERANESDFGLGAVVFGKEKAEEVADALNVGMVGINQSQGASPWVGAKQSGFGYHGSIEGHRQFAQVKVISKR